MRFMVLLSVFLDGHYGANQDNMVFERYLLA
jgi:hypothetical protein